MRARDKYLQRLGKMGREDAKLLEKVFSYFAKKVKDKKTEW